MLKSSESTPFVVITFNDTLYTCRLRITSILITYQNYSVNLDKPQKQLINDH